MKRVIGALGCCLLAMSAGCRDAARMPTETADKDNCARECNCDLDSTASLRESTTVTRWLTPDERKLPKWHGGMAVNQAGETFPYARFAGMPTAMSFVYTRCQNPNKCPLVAATMARLQYDLRKVKLSDRVRLVIMSYDPEFDEPKLLEQYGSKHGFEFSAHAMFLRPDPQKKQELFDELKVSVNFNEEGVNIHGIQLFLFDNQVRFVRRYHTLIWNHVDVSADLKKLTAEQ